MINLTDSYDIFPKPQATKLTVFSAYSQYQRSAMAGYFVLTGCAVSRTSASEVAIASGTFANGGVSKTYAGGSLTSITAASSGKHKIGLIYIDGADDTLKIEYGTEQTPSSSDNFLENSLPLPPNLGDEDWVVLALVRITDSGITDTTFGDPAYATGSVANIRFSGSMAVDNSTITISNGVISTHARDHNINSTDDHNGVSGATENNFISFDSNGLPKDSGHKDSDYDDAGAASTAVSTHEGTYTHSLIADHDARHITSGSDEIDGDKLDIDWNPTYYTPSTSPTEASSVDNLTAHLYGIDQKLASFIDYRYIQFLPQSFGYPTTNSPEFIEVVGTNTKWFEARFDDTTQEYLWGAFRVPDDYNSSGTVTVYVIGRSVTADSSKNVAFVFEHLPRADSEAMDTAETSSASGNSATDATQGNLEVHSWTVSSPGWVAGDWVNFLLSRNPSATSDLTGDWALVTFIIKIPVT